MTSSLNEQLLHKCGDWRSHFKYVARARWRHSAGSQRALWQCDNDNEHMGGDVYALLCIRFESCFVVCIIRFIKEKVTNANNRDIRGIRLTSDMFSIMTQQLEVEKRLRVIWFHHNIIPVKFDKQNAIITKQINMMVSRHSALLCKF